MEHYRRLKDKTNQKLIHIDPEHNTEVTVTVPYNFDDLSWNKGKAPTIGEEGTLTGTSSALPGI